MIRKTLIIAMLAVTTVASAADVAPTPERLTSQQTRDAKVNWKKQETANKARLQRRLIRAQANSEALMASPGTPLKRPYYGDNAGNPRHGHHGGR